MVVSKADKMTKLLSLAREEINRNLTVGLITGTFDITHVDHAKAIQKASQHCDILVVAVKDNKGAARKDPRRPIWDEKERAQLVNCLKGVDYVVIADYDENRKISCNAENEKQLDWLKMFEPVFYYVRPNVLFHEPNPALQSAREEAAKKYKFELFPIKRGKTTSTTNTVKTVLERYGSEKAGD